MASLPNSKQRSISPYQSAQTFFDSRQINTSSISLWMFVKYQLKMKEKKSREDLVLTEEDIQQWFSESTTPYCKTLHLKSYDFKDIVKPAILKSIRWILHQNCANVKSSNPLLLANEKVHIRSMKSPSELLCVVRNINTKVTRYASLMKRRKGSTKYRIAFSP